MTATEAIEHKHYYNSNYSFEGERWSPLKKEGFDDYIQSNCFRIKHTTTDRIIKPSNWANLKHFVVKLKDNEGKFKSIIVDDLFDDFDVIAYKGSTFIYDAY